MGDYEVAGCISGAARLSDRAGRRSKAMPRKGSSRVLPLKGVRLAPGTTTIRASQAAGKRRRRLGHGPRPHRLRLAPADRKFLADWNLIGPFDAPDMDSLTTVYPARERDRISPRRTPAKAAPTARLEEDQGRRRPGYVDLTRLVKPNETGRRLRRGLGASARATRRPSAARKRRRRAGLDQRRSGPHQSGLPGATPTRTASPCA